MPFRTAMLASRMTARFNSTSTTSAASSKAAQVVEMARARAGAAQKPSFGEMGVPVMWALCGVAGWTALQRAEARGEQGAVEKVCLHKGRC